MTLVLSVATPAYSLHVSDRLVSKSGAPYDALANKTVVLRAIDGLLVLGYTGPAYMDGKPTDSWIASVVSRGSAVSDLGAISYGEFAVSDVGSTLRTLSERLCADRYFLRLGGQLSAVGWQWSAKRERALVRNVLWRFSYGRWEQLVPRHLPERKKVFRMIATGNWALSAQAWKHLLDEVGAAGGDWELVEDRLVKAIRQASTLTPGTIGPHCMSVLVTPWQFPNALIRFMPDSAHTGSAFGQRVELAYSPWMVAPDAVLAPSVAVGGLSCEQGLLTYSTEAAAVPDDQTLKSAFQSQDRRPT